MREEEREFFVFLVKVLRRKNGNKNTDRVLAGRVVKIIVPSIVSLLLLLCYQVAAGVIIRHFQAKKYHVSSKKSCLEFFDHIVLRALTFTVTCIGRYTSVVKKFVALSD
jgi:hypothetical protein